jgi:hypothetical protein
MRKLKAASAELLDALRGAACESREMKKADADAVKNSSAAMRVLAM